MSGMKRIPVSGYCSDPDDQSYFKIQQYELNRILGKRVIHAEKWRCPLENAWALLYAVGVGHQGVVITLEDNSRYIVHKLPAPEGNGKGEILVAKATGMGSNWSRFEQKAIRNAKVGDYLEKCGFEYNKYSDNCMHAVSRMWELD